MKFLSIAAAAALMGVSHAAVDKSFTGSVPCSTPTAYRVTFESRWTKRRHPPNYEDADAHWSPPVYASHNSEYVMWKGGIMASPGVQIVAEFGGTTTLRNELDNDNVLDFEIGSVMRNLDQGDNGVQEIGEVEVDMDYPYISGISMIADSPDWFSGMHDINMCDNGVWIDYAEVDGFPYDAGTDDGENYDSGDSANNPAVDIFRLTLDTVPSTKVFVSMSKKGNERVLPVQRTILERVIGDDEVCEDNADFLFRGREGRDCTWVESRNDQKRGRVCRRKQEVNGVEGVVSYICPEACDICP